MIKLCCGICAKDAAKILQILKQERDKLSPFVKFTKEFLEWSHNDKDGNSKAEDCLPCKASRLLNNLKKDSQHREKHKGEK